MPDFQDGPGIKPRSPCDLGLLGNSTGEGALTSHISTGHEISQTQISTFQLNIKLLGIKRWLAPLQVSVADDLILAMGHNQQQKSLNGGVGYSGE